jgi:hypothetical protein
MINSENVKGKGIGVKFDSTINLGHILTFLGFIGTGVVVYQSLDTRVVVLEENRKTQELRDQAQDKTLDNNMREIREVTAEIKKTLEKLSDKIDRKLP